MFLRIMYATPTIEKPNQVNRRNLEGDFDLILPCISLTSGEFWCRALDWF
jgi:hypothetical protein